MGTVLQNVDRIRDSANKTLEIGVTADAVTAVNDATAGLASKAAQADVNTLTSDMATKAPLPVNDTATGEYLTWSAGAFGKHELGIHRPTAGTIAITDSMRMDKPIRAQAALCSDGTLDVSLSNYFICNCNTAMSYTFLNVPTDADVISLVLELHDAGSHAQTFPANVYWGGGVAPAFTSGASDLVGFITTDGGGSWRGMGLNFNSAIPFYDPS